MKRVWSSGEGWLIGATLLALCALTFGQWLNRLPQDVTAAPVHAVSEEELRDVELIDVNSATEEQLDELPGIGPALAEAIVTYREEHGAFTSVEQLDEVPGIGPAKLEAMRPLVRLE